MNIQPIKKINVVEQVFDQMQGLLIEGAWKSGDKLPSENELSETFGVSRMTIRQAMQKLKALGLIETRTGSGSFVREVNLEDSLNDLIPLMYIGSPSQTQIFRFREMIESESVRIATPIVSDKSLALLEERLTKMKKSAEEDNLKSFSDNDLKFHTLIVRETGNPLIIKSYDILRNVLKESMVSVIEKMKYSPALGYHEKILSAMKSRDAELAEKLMREHIRQNYSYFDD